MFVECGLPETAIPGETSCLNQLPATAYSTGLRRAPERVLIPDAGVKAARPSPAGMADCGVVLVTAHAVASLRDDDGQTHEHPIDRAVEGSTTR